MTRLLQLQRFFPLTFIRIILLLTSLLKEAEEPVYSQSIAASNYDYIIVGGGTAGCVLAARLSEVLGWRVLLVEAGGRPPPESRVPALNGLLYQGENDWKYRTTRQKDILKSFKSNAIPYPRGFGAGGSSTINSMIYIRGNRRDFDHWEALGNPGWAYADVLKYFKKSENYQGSRFNDTASYHGYDGPQFIDDKRWNSPVLRGFLKAGKQLGYKVIDPNGPEQIGFSVIDVTSYNGRRWTAADGFLKPASKNNPNLDVLLNCHVMKILFDEDKRAVGIKYKHHKKISTAYVNHEIILSAGAIGSPQLLMLSGIGPAAHLKSKGIPVIYDLPGVGQNFQDHPVVSGLSWTVKKGSSISFAVLSNLKNFPDFLKEGQGPLTSPLGTEGNAWTHSPVGDPDWPEIQVAFISGTPAIDYGLSSIQIFGYDKKFFYDYFRGILGQEGFSLAPLIARPKSRGSVTLASSDPFKHPFIDINFFSHPDDIASLIRGIKFALSIGAAPALRDEHGAKFYNKKLPGCEKLTPRSDAYWECFIRHTGTTSYHPAGTCKMAPTSDPYAVVDSRLRVRGVSGLRVIDASIMPLIVSANLNAAVLMIAEKGADLIKEDAGILASYI